MAKYKVLELLTSLSTGKYHQPGDIIEMDDDEAATILMERGCIIPAERKQIKPPAKFTGLGGLVKSSDEKVEETK